MAKGEHLLGKGGDAKWTKGQSGNPKGKPKGSKDSRTVLNEFFEVVLQGEDPITGKKGEFTIRELLFAKQISKALNDGDTTAFKELMDRYEGKAKQTSSISVNQSHNLRYENVETFEDFKREMALIEEQKREIEEEAEKLNLSPSKTSKND